jgi:hypothetical protein
MTNGHFKHTVLIVAVLLGFMYGSIVQASQAQSNSSLPISVGSKPNGIPYGDWTGKWWQWALSIPLKDNPQNDPTGKNCGLNQTGSVWFLVGTTGGLAERECPVPTGKSILFPIITAECSYIENPDLKTETALKSCVKSQIDQVNNLQVTVDGVILQDLKKYRIQSPIFNINFPQDNIYGVSAGPTKGVSDGYWIFLEPMSPGKHQIYFSGSAVDYTATGTQNFVTGAKYNLTVGP